MKYKRTGGFTLVEVLLATAVLVVTFLVVLTIGLSGRQKTLLNTETDKLKAALEFARQQSLAAYKGEEYAIELLPPNNFRLLPDGQVKELKVTMVEPDEAEILTFQKITGYTGVGKTITLEAGSSKTIITISSLGIITRSELQPQ